MDEAKKEYGAINFPIELQAATTEGYSMHIGTIIFLWFITNSGTTESGRESNPITFSVIESATFNLSPPDISYEGSTLFESLEFMCYILS